MCFSLNDILRKILFNKFLNPYKLYLLLKNNRMFHRAWIEQVGYLPDLTMEESRQRWKQEFGCEMISAPSGKILVEAVFEREEDYTAFVLKWS